MDRNEYLNSLAEHEDHMRGDHKTEELKSKCIEDYRREYNKAIAERDEARKITEDVAQQRADATLQLGEKTLWNARLSRLYAKALLEIVKAERERDKVRAQRDELRKTVKAVACSMRRLLPDSADKDAVLADLDKISANTEDD